MKTMKRLFTKLALLTLSFLGSVAMADDVVSLPASPDCSSGCDIVYNNHSGNLNLNLNNNDPNAGKNSALPVRLMAASTPETPTFAFVAMPPSLHGVSTKILP